ncbi:DUF6438 domain-containing protein [Kordia sp.]|uniref:DUF6438 domain-containing protein n=1 Tax=Kordia sp. TaxID=1965332 RepID=UPI003D6BA213
MRILICFVLFVSLYACSKGKNISYKPSTFTKVDSISSLPELRQFIKNADSSLQTFLCRSPKFYGISSNEFVTRFKRRLDSMFPDFTFIKEDFDGNGYTDLVVTGEYFENRLEVLAIMNYGRETYTVIPLDLRRAEDFPTYPKLVYKNKTPVIELYSSYNFAPIQENGISKNTLVYKFGSFIDYMELSETYQISKIEFRANGCHGACGVFELVLNDDLNATFKAEHYNFSKEPITDFNDEEGYFKTTIDKEKYAEIRKIIEYLQIKNREDRYFSGSFHDPSCVLNVYFKDGSTKTINDTGLIGSNGLYYLYTKFYDLRFNQDWKEIDTIN